MKNIFLSFFSFMLTISGFAKPKLNSLKDTILTLDTPEKKQLSELTGNVKSYGSTIFANVVFPAIFQQSMAQSREYIEKFSKRKREYLINTFQKGQKYFSTAIDIFKKYNLPEELKVLVALESNFNGNAVSPAGAVGFWQFMDESAKDYGLKIGHSSAKGKKTGYIDERRNFLKSTVAAARYLQDRCKYFNNDCLLVVASYNCGLGKIRSAMKHSGKSNATFWDIKNSLPEETRKYVMNFVAMSVIYANYEKFIKNNLTFYDKTGQSFEMATTTFSQSL